MSTIAKPRVIVIEPTKQLGRQEKLSANKKMKVAAYARVSTEQDEQQSSYLAQVNYYTNYIQGNPAWEFVEVYADEGITGTNTKMRAGFRRMVADAKAGKIDLILTKSISRFARNTVDTLSTVRELKGLGVEVWFEKENIRTLDPKCEILLTIMSSLAQEESRSISENVRWGKQKRMQDGVVNLPYKSFLGYRKGKNGRPEIVPEEAKIIRAIYHWFLSGLTIRHITKRLEAENYLTPMGKTNWSVSTVRSILSNEKYKGDALLQKNITLDYLTKKIKKNEGEARQIYIENSHPAIIDPDIFDLVQYELKRRAELKNCFQNNSVLSARIICGECGAFYSHRSYWVEKYDYHYDGWSCRTKLKDHKTCKSSNVQQDEIEAAFATALIEALASPQPLHNEEIGQDFADIIKQRKQELAQAEAQAITALDELEMIARSAKKLSKEKYQKRHQAALKKVELNKEAVEEARLAVLKATVQKVKHQFFFEATKDLGASEIEFSDTLFINTVDKIIVSEKSGRRYLEFHFRNDAVVRVGIDG